MKIIARVLKRIKRVQEMSDLDLLYLKLKKRYPTQTLLKRFPKEQKRIAEIAMVDVKEQVLEKIIPERAVLTRIHHLKDRFNHLKQPVRVPVPVLIKKGN